MAATMLPRTIRPNLPLAPRSAWGETKKCPACGEKIKSIALRCRYCGTEFDTVDPLSLKDLRKQVVKEERLQSTRALVVVLFVLSIVGCLAPIIAIAATAYVAHAARHHRQGRADLSGHGLFRDGDLLLIFDTDGSVPSFLSSLAVNHGTGILPVRRHGQERRASKRW